MFQVKVCGIKDAQTAAFCSSLGIGAIGLNFYGKSKRYVNPESARSIVDATESSTLKVGLFVNHDAETIIELSADLDLDAIQLHGTESVEIVDQLSALPDSQKIIRAVRISKSNQSEALREIESWSGDRYRHRIGAILLDAWVDNSFGGTGQQIDWEWLAGIDLPTDKPIILAGGLKPENVAQAISVIKPAGVDVAGGVEDSEGNKHPDLIRDFHSIASQSFDRI